jgi:hypothetical protein
MVSMSRRTLKATEIGLYLAAGLLAVGFRVQSSSRDLDLYLLRDALDTFTLPYVVFLVFAWLLYRFSKSMPFAFLSLTVSMLVLTYTLISYIRVLYVWKCDPRICWVFIGTPIVLLLGGFSFLLVGTLGIRVYSQLKQSSG